MTSTIKFDLISSEASWRPVNLLVFDQSHQQYSLGDFHTALLSQFHWLIAVVLIMALIPQGLMVYRIQQQALKPSCQQ